MASRQDLCTCSVHRLSAFLSIHSLRVSLLMIYPSGLLRMPAGGLGASRAKVAPSAAVEIKGFHPRVSIQCGSGSPIISAPVSGLAALASIVGPSCDSGLKRRFSALASRENARA